ncbi:MAG: amidohydrolase family protein, partial [Alphaproteobacteria bacterium]|nr:amidohydrolase family protein [Alphaproteobacteria bacterium]
MSATVIIRGGLVLAHADAVPALLDVQVVDGRITAVGRPGMAAPAGARAIDARGRILIPGLINAHTHSHGALMKGCGDCWNLELLLNAGPWITGHRTAGDKALSTKLCAVESLLKGCTTVYDLFVEFPVPTPEGAVAVGEAFSSVGMRAVVAPMLADRSFYQAIPGLMDALPAQQRDAVGKFRYAPGEANLEACRQALKDWPLDRDHVRFAMAPTIPLHCADEFMVAAARMARDFDTGFHTHLAESKVQAVAGRERYGRTLTAHLDALGILGPNFTAAHAVWLDSDDARRMGDKGASVAHNPGSNMRLGSGIAPARDFLGAGVNVGIGTDGAHCSDNQNMFEAMRLAAFASRVRGPRYEQWLTTREVFRMATEASAKALGFGGRLGRIETGYLADIVFLDRTSVNLVPLNDLVNQLVL